MRAQTPDCPVVVSRLPAPLARLCRRAYSAKGSFDLHHTACCLWEATLKLLGSIAVAEYSRQESPSACPAKLFQPLARPTLGAWWALTRQILSSTDGTEERLLARLRTLSLERLPDGSTHLKELAIALRRAVRSEPHGRAPLALGDLCEAFIQYQRMTRRSGQPGDSLPIETSDRMGEQLLTGAVELFAELDALSPWRLVHAEDVRRAPDGNWNVQYRFLNDQDPATPLNSVVSPGAAQSLPWPLRVYLVGEEDSAAAGEVTNWIPVHPLLCYRPEKEEVFFLNSHPDSVTPDYVCYDSGAMLPGGEFQESLAELLSRLLGSPVNGESLEHWAVASMQTDIPQAAGGDRSSSRKIGEFELLTRIGWGGMGVVYRAWQVSVGRQVALKCLRASWDPNAEERFAREIRALGRVEHPNLVKIYTSGKEGDQLYYAMELVEGAPLAAVSDKLQSGSSSAAAVNLDTWCQALSTVCEEHRRAEETLGDLLPDSDALRRASVERPTSAKVASESYIGRVVELMRQVAMATEALHQVGVIHRDIKPGNIIVTGDGSRAVLMDLGLVQLTDESQGALTRTRQFVGTLRYASPEQVLAVSRLSPPSDVYSLGATLWELLTLRPMFDDNGATGTPEIMERIQYQEPERVRKYNPQISVDLEAVVMKCLEKDRRRRYASAQELADDLARWQRGEPVRAKPFTAWYRARKWIVRRRREACLGVVAGAAVLLVSLVMAKFIWPPPPVKVEPHWPSVHAVLTVPGLNGQWWFEEMPWLTPIARYKLASDPAFRIRDPVRTGHFVETLISREPTDRRALTDPTVTSMAWSLVEDLAIAVESRKDDLPDYQWEMIKSLRTIDEERLSSNDLQKHLESILAEFEKAVAQHEASAMDKHLRGAINHQIALLSQDRERARIAQKWYEDAFASYRATDDLEKDLRCLCMVDMARLLSDLLLKDENGVRPDVLSRVEELLDLGEFHDTSVAFQVDALIRRGDACSSAGEYTRANEAYGKAINLARELGMDNSFDPHPLAANAYERHAWSLMDQWQVVPARERFETAKDYREKLVNDRLSGIFVFHNQHGLAIAQRYCGDTAEARRSFDSLLKGIDAAYQSGKELKDDFPCKQPYLRLLEGRLQNSLERAADCELYQWSQSDAEHLRQACERYGRSYELSADPVTRAAMGAKWSLCLALAGDTEDAKNKLKETTLPEGTATPKYSKRLEHIKQAAEAVVRLNTEGWESGAPAIRQFLDRFDPHVRRPEDTERDVLEVRLLAAELLVNRGDGMKGVSLPAKEDVDRLGQLLSFFGQRGHSLPFLTRFWRYVGQRSGKGATPLALGFPKHQQIGLRAVLVGVATYSPSAGVSELNVADKDAKDLDTLFRSLKGKLFSTVEVESLINEQAKKDSILKKVGWLRNELTKPGNENDLGVIWLSGHGQLSKDRDAFGQRFLFLPYDYNPNLEEQIVGLFPENIAEKLAGVRGKVLIVVDACHSGGFTDRASETFATRVDRDHNVLVLAACLAAQAAEESQTNGLLTQALKEAISGEGVPEQLTGLFPVPEGWPGVPLFYVARYAQVRVGQMSEDRQLVSEWGQSALTRSVALGLAPE